MTLTINKAIYGYEQLMAAAEMSLPDEIEIINALELECHGIKGGFDVIPTLNDLISQRQAHRILGKSVAKFENSALRLYEDGEINESQLWDIAEKVVRSLK